MGSNPRLGPNKDVLLPCCSRFDHMYRVEEVDLPIMCDLESSEDDRPDLGSKIEVTEKLN